ncbi:MAG: cytochrome c, partial [Planctomycetes bacterium]|nr:cytochrome c [Planctomycetota bacterium]
LNPRPRDYRRGAFKFTSTDKDTAKPTRDDLLRTFKNGVPGTSMPSFALYDAQEVERILDYVILLSIRGEAERFLVDSYQPGEPITTEVANEKASIVADFWNGTDQKVVKPKTPPPPPNDKSLANGKKLYLNTNVQCFNCHGREGRGDGLESGLATGSLANPDAWGDQLKPADLTLGVYRGGGRPLDLFRRIHAGVKGGRMPSQAANLKEDQIWDLVNYIRALPFEDQKVAQATPDGPESSAKHN